MAKAAIVLLVVEPKHLDINPHLYVDHPVSSVGFKYNVD